MNVTVVRLRADAASPGDPKQRRLLQLCEEGLAIFLRLGMENHALFVHLDLEPPPMLLVCPDEEHVPDISEEIPAEFGRELLELAKSDFNGIGEHFEMPASQVGSQYSPVLLLESGDAKSYWVRTWTDSILQFQRIIQSQ